MRKLGYGKDYQYDPDTGRPVQGGGRLYMDHRHVVADHVVQFTGDAQPLLRGSQSGLLLGVGDPGVAHRPQSRHRDQPAGQREDGRATGQHPGPDRRVDALTGREREVMQLIAAGCTNTEIAARLVVSPLTAKTHVSRIMAKLGAREAARRIAADEQLAAVKVVMLTTFDLDEYVSGALRAGATGFFVKDTEPAELLHVVRVAVRGDALISPSITRRLIAEFANRPDNTRGPEGRRHDLDRAAAPRAQASAHG